MQKVRCAIYTRKSTDEGLDKEFNTLEAQREAGEAYVKSQVHEGWEIIKDRYDDGGFSGGNTERPALKRLIRDVKDGYVDMIVVYKIDRLTRSLYDFSKMVELFDEHKVSFVSVTQQFNTSTSMGRLTLNVLLSFAQFEREVSGERIRDKIAASKRKGMWMGGPPVFGYDIKDRKLVINEEEAEIVKVIFERYLKTASYVQTAKYLNEKGYKTKSWISKKGVEYVGKEWCKQNIYKILKHPIYIGLMPHKGKNYEGEHEAIIDKKRWDEVQDIILKTVPQRKEKITENNEPLLKSLIYCDCCNTRMIPTRTNKGNKRYNYYVSLNATKKSYEKCLLGNIPANDIEKIVIGRVKYMLQNIKVKNDIYDSLVSDGYEINKKYFLRQLRDIDSIWDYLCPKEINEIVKTVVKKVIVGIGFVEIEYNERSFMKLLED